MEALLSLWKNIASISLEAENALLHHWNFQNTFKKGEYLIQLGQKEHYLYFVLEGSFRIYYPAPEHEISAGFSYQNTLLCSYPSFVKNEASAYAIQCISDASVIGIHRKDFYQLCESHHDIEIAWRRLTEEALLGKIEREMDILSLKPEERYIKLWNRSPHVFQIIPQKYLASYLGMSPETFSRIKKRILQQRN